MSSHPKPSDSAGEPLNPEQRLAVEHVEGPLLVLAGAGSGKTRVLTVRVARLIQQHGVPPDRILAVTFTNKAAGELKDRIRRLLGHDPIGAWVGTFHSLGARILRRHAQSLGFESSFTIFDAEESLREVKRVMGAQGLDTKRWSPKAVRATLSDAKNQLVTPGEFTAEHGDGFDLFLKTVARVYPEYHRSLKSQNALDFDDLLVKPLDLFDTRPETLEAYQRRFAFILVDEYQDTNHAQFRFLESLARPHENLMVVGDDDQSIYGWRGADIRTFLGLSEGIRARESSASSETTARLRRFSTRRTPSSAGISSERRKRFVRSESPERPSHSSKPPTRPTRQDGLRMRSNDCT